MIARETDPERLQQLLTQARQGNRHAFAALENALLAPVTRFARRLVGQRDEVDDIVQEVFLALYLNLRRIEQAEGLLPFLYRVTRNKSYDILRAQGRYSIVSSDNPEMGGGSTFVDPSPHPSMVCERLALWEEVRVAMERLPEVQRQTLILYAEEDFTYTQISEAMQIDVGTVRSRLFHARKNLMRHLRPETCAAFGLTRPGL